MNVPLTIAVGGEAAIVENQGDHVVVRSSQASPPGSTLNLDHQGLAIQVKVRGCKRVEDGPLPFRIEGRLVSFTRVAREQVFGTKTDEH
jgi:hypothetical protein